MEPTPYMVEDFYKQMKRDYGLSAEELTKIYEDVEKGRINEAIHKLNLLKGETREKTNSLRQMGCAWCANKCEAEGKWKDALKLSRHLANKEQGDVIKRVMGRVLVREITREKLNEVLDQQGYEGLKLRFQELEKSLKKEDPKPEDIDDSVSPPGSPSTGTEPPTTPRGD